MDTQIVALVTDIQKKIIERYYSMKLNASGDFAKDLRVEDYGAGVRLISNAYIHQMENGRNRGAMPPVSAIKQWIKDKNANAGTDIPEEAAWAIAISIRDNGIKVPNAHNAGNVVSAVLNPSEVKRLTTEVSEIVKAKILSILNK